MCAEGIGKGGRGLSEWEKIAKLKVTEFKVKDILEYSCCNERNKIHKTDAILLQYRIFLISRINLGMKSGTLRNGWKINKSWNLNKYRS